MDLAGRLDNSNRELRNERNRCEAIDSEVKNLLAENKAMRQQADHAKAIAKLQDDEIALLRSREKKTIVEHVHVLEKAKRVTDRELAATKVERDQLAAVMKSMEQQKSRLIGDIEDMARQNEILRAGMRNVQQPTGPTKEELEKEREARHKAENRASQHAPLSDEVARLKSQILKQQDTVSKLEKEVDRARTLTKHDDSAKLLLQISQYQDQVVRLQKDLTIAKGDADSAKASAMNTVQHRTTSGPSPSIKALQELHLGNEQLSKSMAEELRRNRLGPLADATVRGRNENNRHSLDFGSMRTSVVNIPEDSDKFNLSQQKMARDVLQCEYNRWAARKVDLIIACLQCKPIYKPPK